jgi:hypothetical protein
MSRRSVQGGQAGFLGAWRGKFLAPAIRFLYAWRGARTRANERGPDREKTTVCADQCCEPPALVLPPKAPSGREALIREAFKLEWLTIGWMSVEAIVALASGVAAGSLVLIAFGLDSVIELASAGALVWRLRVELRRGHAFSENAERLASRIAGGLLFALAAYVTIAAL